MYRASYCNACINQRDAQILVNNLYFFVKLLYMFRSIISPSSGATFNKLYSAIGTCRSYLQEFVHLVGLYTQSYRYFDLRHEDW